MPRFHLLEDLHNQDAVIKDEPERKKSGHPNIGDTVEIMNHRARIVGFGFLAAFILNSKEVAHVPV